MNSFKFEDKKVILNKVVLIEGIIHSVKVFAKMIGSNDYYVIDEISETVKGYHKNMIFKDEMFSCKSFDEFISEFLNKDY